MPYYLQQADGSEVSINPMNEILSRSQGVDSVEDLDNITLYDEQGNSKPLIPAGTSDDDKQAIVDALQQFPHLTSNLPEDGSVSTDSPDTTQMKVSGPTTWALSLRGRNIRFHGGKEAVLKLGYHRPQRLLQPTTLQLDAESEPVLTAAGDFFRWVGDVVEDVTEFVFDLVGDVWHVMVTIAEETMYFIVECIADVINTLLAIFNAILVVLEDLVKWLGFIFQWNDILRSKDALKNIVNQYIAYSQTQLPNIQADLDQFFGEMSDVLEGMAGLDAGTDTVNSLSSNNPPPAASQSPQAQWSSYQFQQNISAANVTYDAEPVDSSDLETLLNDVVVAMENEGEIFVEAIEDIYTQILTQLNTLSLTEIVTRLLAILANALVETAQNILDTVIEILGLLMSGLSDVLNAEIDIPVLSWLYEEIAGSQLTIMDLACLVAAFPATILFKVVNGQAPFPDNSFTSSVINAGSWSELQDLYTPTTTTTAAVNFNSRAMDSSIPAGADENLLTLYQFLHSTAAISGVVFSCTTLLKSLDGESKAISITNGAFFYLTTAPNLAAGIVKSPSQTWYQILNEAVYGLTAIQKFVDMFTYKKDTSASMMTWSKVSPWVDVLLGLCATVPPIASLCYNLTGWGIVSTFSSVAWNGGRVLTPFAKVKVHPTIFLVKEGCILTYSILRAIMSKEGDETV